jgi:membrane fusion protein, multidrug efflux system
VQQREPSADRTVEAPTRAQPDSALHATSSRLRGARTQLAVLALAGLAVLGWYVAKPLLTKTAAPAAGPAASPPAQVTVAKPVVKSVVETQEFSGRFVASDQVDIRARVGGYIDTIHFADGALVKRGDPLFTIDQRPSKFAIEQAEATIKNTKARIEFAQADLTRAETLRQSGVTSQTIAEQRRRDLLVAQGDLAAAQATAGRARLDLEYAQIKAPFAGRVSRKNVSVGNLVKVDDTILTTLVATDPMHFYFDVDERSVLTALRPQLDSLSVKETAPPVAVQIALTDETDYRYKGVLDFTDNRLDEASGTLRTRALVANADLTLKPGLFGRIRIPGLAPKSAILIPDEAIGSDQDRRIVYVVTEENSAKATTITMGPRIDGYRVVRTGLTGDETIIVNGLLRVRPGAKVTPKMTTLPAVGGQPAMPTPASPAPTTPASAAKKG